MNLPTRFVRSFSIPHVRVSICARTRRFPGAHLRVVMDRLNLAGITNIVVVTQPLEKSKK